MEDHDETEAKNFPSWSSHSADGEKPRPLIGVLDDRARLPIGIDLQFAALLNGGLAFGQQGQLVSGSSQQRLGQQG